jgi:hypothetical protein
LAAGRSGMEKTRLILALLKTPWFVTQLSSFKESGVSLNAFP